jgi:thiamine-monophosphate kinase
MIILEDKEPKRTSLAELGEFGLIKYLTDNIQLQHDSSILGVGDDAAVLDLSSGNTVITTDMLTEGVHFDLTYVPLKHLGYKAVSVNVSDVYAMNATPTQITVSIAVSSRFPLEAIEELYAGVHLACKQFDVDLIGGDTTSSTSGLTISITAIGTVAADKVVKRSGAKANDLLVVTGDLGGAYMGLQVLEREKAVYAENPNMQPELAGYDYILERQLKPEARMDIPKLLEEMGVQPTSMIDISDGLSSETIHLCKASGVGVKIYEDKIPLDPMVISSTEEFKIDSTMVALSGGEDYELLMTIAMDDFEKIKGNPSLTVIGHMCEEKEGMYLITRDGGAHPLTAQGWDALLKEEKGE